MECRSALDFTGAPKMRLYGLIQPKPFWLLVFLVLLLSAERGSAQAGVTPESLFKAERWPALVAALTAEPSRSAEHEYQYGIALAHLERWDEARSAFRRGSELSPADKRFPEELAGVAFKQKNNSEAIQHLRRALRIDPKDDYAADFLATIYFLDGNLEAAISYWNKLNKPQVAEVRTEPKLQVRPALLDHAIAFGASSTFKLNEFRITEQRVNNLQIFPVYRFDLAARDEGKFDAILRAQELNGFGNGKVQSVVRMLRGIAFQEITPEYDNLGDSAINIAALGRWDVNKRRYQASISGPLWQMPEWRFWVSAGARNENWDMRQGFTGPAPILACSQSAQGRRGGGDRKAGWVALALAPRD